MSNREHNKPKQLALAMSLIVAGMFFGGLAQGQMSPDPGTRINAAMQRAKQQGLPLTYLETKHKEGLAKRVSIERLATALESFVVELEQAHHWLHKEFELSAPVAETTVIAAAQTIRSGIPLDAIAAAVRIAEQRGIGARTSLLLASDLRARGVPMEVAISLTEKFVTSAMPGDDRSLMFALERLTTTPGHDVRTAAQQIRDRLAEANHVRPAHMILESLGRPPGWVLEGGAKNPGLAPSGVEIGGKAASKKKAEIPPIAEHAKKNKGLDPDNHPTPPTPTTPDKPDKPDKPGKPEKSK